MNNRKTFYIALGSNKGDKFKNLQAAVVLINQNIGDIMAVSKVYSSPAFGFESDDFLNCCLVLESNSEPQDLLDNLLDIEIALGRTRKEANTYEARTIDLDIILVDDLIIDTQTLQVPHPEMHKRKFVLLPLNDLCPQKTHPKLKKEMSALLMECEDTSVLEAFDALLEL